MLWVAGIGLAVVFCIAVVLLLGNAVLNGGLFQQAPTPTATLSLATSTNSPTLPVVLVASETSLPIATPTETTVPLTPTPTGPYVVITGIRLENNVYVVDYEVHNFPESPSLHVHMFFNTVPPEQAGSPGNGPWKLTWGAYGDPPFTQYGPSNRPANATQLCSLVANPNHTVILNTGNCVDLPEEGGRMFYETKIICAAGR